MKVKELIDRLVNAQDRYPNSNIVVVAVSAGGVASDAYEGPVIMTQDLETEFSLWPLVQYEDGSALPDMNSSIRPLSSLIDELKAAQITCADRDAIVVLSDGGTNRDTIQQSITDVSTYVITETGEGVVVIWPDLKGLGESATVK